MSKKQAGCLMFGYVKPDKAELLVKEYELYRATYCGICRAMKKYTGALSNVTLTYDSVFLALVRMLYLPDGAVSARKRRCIAHPFESRPMLDSNEAIEYTARAFAILTYYKMKDDLHDEKLLRRVAVGAARPIVSHANRKAHLPSLEKTVGERLAKISGLEDAACESIDEPAQLFGELLGEIFAYGMGEDDRLVLYELGLHLGRFIYCADAAEDYERDAREGKYNPYVIAYGGEPLTDENRETIKCGLLLECKRLEAAVNLLPFGSRASIENIIKNIIYLGLVKRIEFLDGEKKEKKS